MNGEAGKGGSPRPYSVSQEEFGRRFDNVFRKKPPRTWRRILRINLREGTAEWLDKPEEEESC